jgi:hypothetical protein
MKDIPRQQKRLSEIILEENNKQAILGAFLHGCDLANLRIQAHHVGGTVIISRVPQPGYMDIGMFDRIAVYGIFWNNDDVVIPKDKSNVSENERSIINTLRSLVHDYLDSIVQKRP